MSVALRPAGVADADVLAALARRSFTETFGHLYTVDDLAAFLAQHTPDGWAAGLADSDHAVLLAEEDGHTAGYAKLGPRRLPTEGAGIELRQFYILGRWQGSGLAARMMDWVLAESRARRAEALWLSVFIDNPRARRFYARYGFEEVGRYAFMVGNQRDEDLILRMPL